MAKYEKKEQRGKRLTKRQRRLLERQGNVVGFTDQAEWQGRVTERDHKDVTFEPRGRAQAEFMQLIKDRQLVIGYGSAGTGKTHVPVAYACEELIANRIKKIILVRPIVEAKGEGNGIGLLPGDVAEKCAPHIQVFRDMLSTYFTDNHLDMLFKRGQVEFQPLELMRGKTFADCVLIADEIQNASPGQMELLLTRIGEPAKFILAGDTRQKDIKKYSGLADLMRRLPDDGKDVGYFQFYPKDVIRSGLARKIVMAYEEELPPV